MEQLYEQLGAYIVTCVDDTETLKLLIKEFMPLMKQVNYAALTADALTETSNKLGLGDQAQVILSNLVSIYRVNGGEVHKLMTSIGINNDTATAIMNDLNFIWVPAGILLMGSGILTQLRETLNDDSKRSNPNRT